MAKLGKQADAVFWIGLLLILVNFWVSGQSTILWKSLTESGRNKSKSAFNPGAYGKRLKGHPTPNNPVTPGEGRTTH